MTRIVITKRHAKKSPNCKWDWSGFCTDKSMSTECGLSRQCNHYECQDENVCNKATSCRWDRWKGCHDKSSKTQCGVNTSEMMCKKAVNCKWDRWEGCTDKSSTTQCGVNTSAMMCKKAVNCKWDRWEGCHDKTSTECGLSRACNYYECQDESMCNKGTGCKWDKWNNACVRPDSNVATCGVGLSCNDFACNTEEKCIKTKKCTWDRWDGCKAQICACPMIYAPVCGENGKDYSNTCSAECEGVKVSCAGKCPCKDKPSTAECGVTIPCDGKDCKGDKKMCLKARRCNWDRYYGCKDQWNTVKCGLSKTCYY